MRLLPHPSMFSCQRCETVVQAGHNCSIRIEKNASKGQKRSEVYTKNDVVFTCHFCSHRNLKRGTPKDHMKLICPPKEREPTNSHLRDIGGLVKNTRNGNESNKMAAAMEMEIIPIVDSPISLLDSKKKRRNRIWPKKPAEPETNLNAKSDASNKRRRKCWTSLKDIAENQLSPNVADITIPFIF